MPEKNLSARSGLKQQIYRDLKHRLIYCIYPPGTALNELMLAKEFGVSRTPIREAVSQLELDGYVKILPKKGIYVNDLTLEDARQIFQTRLEIEPVALRMAAPYLDANVLLDLRRRIASPPEDLGEAFELDMDMLLYLISCCRNTYVISMMNRLFDDNKRMVIYTGQNRAKLHDAAEEHLGILDSLITQQDVDVCAGLMRSHIRTCRREALAVFADRETP